MFVGRESELKALTEFMNAAETKAATVYGRRRIGKTTLLRKAIVDAPGKTIFFEALDGRYETNLNLLAKQVSDLLGAPLGSFQHHLDLFHTLQLYKEPLTIVIDEYQFLKQSRTGNEVDSEFKQIIDQLPGNMKLILTGSHVTMMKELLEQDNPLFGRFQLVMRVDELEYWQAQAFYPDLPVYDKACFHSVFGACPYILENLNPAIGLRDNIINMFEAELEAQALLHTRHRIKRELECNIDRRSINIDEYENHIQNLTRDCNPRKLYYDLCQEFRSYVTGRRYNSILRVYNQKAMLPNCGVVQMCGFANKDKYIKFILSLLRENHDEARIIRTAMRETVGLK